MRSGLEMRFLSLFPQRAWYVSGLAYMQGDLVPSVRGPWFESHSRPKKLSDVIRKDNCSKSLPVLL